MLSLHQKPKLRSTTSARRELSLEFPDFSYQVVDRCSSHEFALIQFLCSPDAFIYRARMDAVRYLLNNLTDFTHL